MNYKVFYAWQADRDEKICRWFILKAAQLAAKKLSQLQVEGAPALEPIEDKIPGPETEVEVDWATKDVPGTPNIAETILEKIKNCGVFLADVTLSSKMTTADGREKHLPNPNVMIELGAAVAWIGWERILLVMNTAFGGPENLPFDLKHRSFPLTYELADHGDSGRKEARKALANAISGKLSLMQSAGVYTRALQEAAERALIEAAQEREQFESAVLQEANLKHKSALIAISIVPAIRPKQTIRLGEQSIQGALRDALQPLFFTGCALEPHPKSVKCASNSGSTELFEDGRVRAAYHINMGPGHDSDQVWPLQLLPFQEAIIAGIVRNLEALRALNVAGPWYIGVSLLKMARCHFIVNPPFQLRNGMGRPFQDDHIRLDPRLVPSDVQLTTKDLETLFERQFVQLWRHCGYGGYPVELENGVITWRV